MTRHVEVMELVARAEGRRAGLRSRHRGAHGVGDRGQGRRQGDHPPRRHHRGGMDRRRLRARRGAQGRARGACRRRAAHGFGAAGKSARRTRRQARREPRRRALCAATCARARAPWTFSSNRYCRIPRWSFSARVRWRCRWRRRRGSSAITSRWRRRRPICQPRPTRDVIIDGFALALSQRGATFCRGLDAGQGRRGRVEGFGRDRCRVPRLRRQPPQDGGAARQADRRRHRRHSDSIASRRRPASTSAPSRRRKSRCRSWLKSPPCEGADSAPR